MLNHAIPPEGATCASCGRPAMLRLVVMNYPDQDLDQSNRQLEAFVDPTDPRPLPITLDLCEFCWKSLYSRIAANVYTAGEVEHWDEYLKPYPPGVNVRQPDGTYRSSESLREEEYFRQLSPEEFREYQRYQARGFKRRPKRWPPE